MIFDYVSLAYFWYYFNILAVTGIIYLMLGIMYQRSKRVIVNTSEQPFKPDNSMLKLVFRIALVAIIWLLVREYGLSEYVSGFFNWTSDILLKVYNG